MKIEGSDSSENDQDSSIMVETPGYNQIDEIKSDLNSDQDDRDDDQRLITHVREKLAAFNGNTVNWQDD
jgi:hypothetical protein